MAPETPKSHGMSSRLLSMKFMQRAVTSSPADSSPTVDKHSAKRRKLGEDSTTASPMAVVDEAAIQAALREIEDKRQQALEKHATSLSDTHWVINLPNTDTVHDSPSQTVSRPVEYVGYAAVDIPTTEAGDAHDQTPVGRMTIGRYKGRKGEGKKSQTQEHSTSEDSDDDTSDVPPSKKRSKSRSQTTESAKAREFRERRKSKEVKLNKLISISSAGSSSRTPPSNTNFSCHKCGVKGHKAANCPKR